MSDTYPREPWILRNPLNLIGVWFAAVLALSFVGSTIGGWELERAKRACEGDGGYWYQAPDTVSECRDSDPYFSGLPQ